MIQKKKKKPEQNEKQKQKRNSFDHQEKNRLISKTKSIEQRKREGV